MAGSSGLECFLPQREKSLRARLSDITRLHINNISQSCDELDHKYIKGTIMSQWPPILSDTVGKQVEFTVRDESLPNGKYIKVFLVGSIANDFPLEAVGNVVYILNCSIVEDSNNTPHSHKFHLSCNSNVSSPHIWLLKKNTDTENQENKGTKKVKDSDYPLISSLKIGTTVNLYGVVKAFKDARKSNGEDYYSNVILIDESGEEISCNLFSSNPSLLPKIKSVGNILRLHRLKIKSHCGNNQGVGTQKCGCSNVVFDGNCGTEIIPHTSSSSFQFTDYDKKRVRELREWAAQQHQLHTCIRLSAIGRDLRFDLICQVVSVGIDEDNLRAYLGVWDGTKANVNVRVPELVDEVKEKIRIDHELEASTGSLVVNVTLYDDHIDNVRNIKCRDFVILKNLHAAGYSNDGVDLCIHRGQGFGRGVFKCSPTDPDAINLKKLLDDTIDVRQHRLASKTLHPDVPFTTIAEMNNLEVPHKHHLKVQVTQVLPPDIIRMVKLYCPQCKSKYEMTRGDSSDVTRDTHDAGDQCPLCANKSSSPEEALSKLKYAFRMELRLEDYTGVINAYVVEEDAADMFPDLPAANLSLDQTTRDALFKKLSYLCGGTNPFDTPLASIKSYSRPWLDCCVKSYYVGGKPKNPTDKHKVAYRIFDTILNSP